MPSSLDSTQSDRNSTDVGPETESNFCNESRPKGASNGGKDRATMPRRRFLILAGVSAVALAGGFSPIRAETKPRAHVGFMLPKRGALAKEASSLISGFELFLKEHPDKAPLLEIIKRDTGPEEGQTLEAVAELVVNKKVEFLIGPLSLEAATKAIHAVNGSESLMFVVNPCVRFVAGELCFPGAFRLTPNTYQSAHALASWALKNLGPSVFITGGDNPTDNELADFFALGLERAGGTFTDRIMISDARRDVHKVIDAVRKADPAFVFASLRDHSAISFVKAFRSESSHLSKPLIGPESLAEYPETVSNLGRSAHGIRTLTFLPNPEILASKIKTKLGRTVAQTSRAAEGYDIANLICNVLEKLPNPATPLSETIKAIEEAKIEGTRGIITFDKNHEPILQAMVREWERDGDKLGSRIVENLGEIKSLDFGCGRVGFPTRRELPPVQEEEAADIED